MIPSFSPLTGERLHANSSSRPAILSGVPMATRTSSSRSLWSGEGFVSKTPLVAFFTPRMVAPVCPRISSSPILLPTEPQVSFKVNSSTRNTRCQPPATTNVVPVKSVQLPSHGSPPIHAAELPAHHELQERCDTVGHDTHTAQNQHHREHAPGLRQSSYLSKAHGRYSNHSHVEGFKETPPFKEHVSGSTACKDQDNACKKDCDPSALNP